MQYRQLRLRSLRCPAPAHDLARLATNSLAANRWIRAQRPVVFSTRAYRVTLSAATYSAHGLPGCQPGMGSMRSICTKPLRSQNALVDS